MKEGGWKERRKQGMDESRKVEKKEFCTKEVRKE